MIKHSELYKNKGYKFENENLNRYIQSKNIQDERKDKRTELFLRNRNIPVEKKKTEIKPTKIATPKVTAKTARSQSTKTTKSSLENRPPFVVGIVHYPLCPIPPLNINLPRMSRQTAAKTEEKIKKISKATEKRLAARNNKTNNENVTLASANGKTPRSNRVFKSAVKNCQIRDIKKRNAENRNELREKVASSVDPQVKHKKENMEIPKQMKEDNVDLNATFEMDLDKSVFKDAEQNLHPEIKTELGSIKKAADSSVESISLHLSAESSKFSVPEDEEPNFISPFVVCSRGKKNARDEQKSRLSLSVSLPNDDVPTKDTVMEKLNVSLEEEEKTAQYLMHQAKKEEERLKGLCNLWESEINGVANNVKQKIETVIEDARVLINKKFDWFLSLANNCKHGNGEELVSSKDLLCFWEMVRGEIQEIDRAFEFLTELKSRDWRTSSELKESLPGNVDRLIAERIPPKFTSTPKVQLNRSLLEGLNHLTLKVPEIELDKSISYINSEQTPARGILKKVEDGSSSGEKGNKSVQKVNFSDTISESPPFPEQQQLKLSKTDLVTDDENTNLESVRVDRKLIFDESDLTGVQAKSIFAEMMEVKSQKLEANKNQKETVVKHEKTYDAMSDDEEIVVKSLRSRTVLSSNKGRSKSENFERSTNRRRKMLANSDDAENSFTPTKTKRNRKTITFATPHNHDDELVVTGKRSIRKSIKFNEDVCTACTPQKRQQKSATPRKTGSAKKIRF